MEYHFSHRVLFFLSSVLFDKLTLERQSQQKKCIDKVVNGLLRQIEKMPLAGKTILDVWRFLDESKLRGCEYVRFGEGR